MPKRLISLVIPAYNEEGCVDELARRLAAVFDSEKQYDFECIIVENGSLDSTMAKLIAINEADKRFKILQLARNFRMDGGLTAGLSVISGDACVLMTADLQDPPELIPSFLRLWEEGYENVYGVVTKRKGTGRLRAFNSEAFYWIAAKLTDNRIPKNASDFRLIDKKVYEAIRSLEERNRFVRGLVAWVGFKSVGIPMERPPRFAGVSNAPTWKTVDLALKGIFAHSYVPLRLITIFGFIVSVSSGIALIAFLVGWLAFGVPFNGFGTLTSIMLLGFGFTTLILGVIGEYIGLIYEESKARPNFVVSRTIGL